MFDPSFDQAAGLRSLEPPAVVRVLPIVLGRDGQGSFDLAWTLGAALSALGHRVVALDAATRESATQPGLAQWLRTDDFELTQRAASAWQVLPAQSGLQTLIHQASTQGAAAALQRLGGSFHGEAVLLMLAPKEWLGVLLEGLAAQPLVPVSAEPSSVVDAYGALKLLYQAAGLRSILVALPAPEPQGVSQQAMRVLGETAQRYLGWQPETHTLPAGQTSQDPHHLTRWVLRMAESALRVEPTQAHAPDWGAPTRPALVPQLWSC